MNFYRITDPCTELEMRQTYGLLEKLSTFTLLECRHIKDINKVNLTDTLVLDHFDESTDPYNLLDQITQHTRDTSNIILVERDTNFTSGCMSALDIRAHIVFKSGHDSDRNNSEQQELLINLIHRRKEMAA